MRADPFERVQQRFLETAVEGHALVLRQIAKKGGESLLETHRHIDAVDLERGAGVVDVVSKSKLLAIPVAHPIIAQSVGAVSRRLHDVDAVCALVLVEVVGVSDHEVD